MSAADGTAELTSEERADRIIAAILSEPRFDPDPARIPLDPSTCSHDEWRQNFADNSAERLWSVVPGGGWRRVSRREMYATVESLNSFVSSINPGAALDEDEIDEVVEEALFWCGGPSPAARYRGIIDNLDAQFEGNLNRNQCLYWSTCRVFDMVEAGDIDEADAVAELEATATRIGLEPGEIRATINSARHRPRNGERTTYAPYSAPFPPASSPPSSSSKRGRKSYVRASPQVGGHPGDSDGPAPWSHLQDLSTTGRRPNLCPSCGAKWWSEQVGPDGARIDEDTRRCYSGKCGGWDGQHKRDSDTTHNAKFRRTWPGLYAVQCRNERWNALRHRINKAGGRDCWHLTELGEYTLVLVGVPLDDPRGGHHPDEVAVPVTHEQADRLDRQAADLIPFLPKPGRGKNRRWSDGHGPESKPERMKRPKKPGQRFIAAEKVRGHRSPNWFHRQAVAHGAYQTGSDGTGNRWARFHRDSPRYPAFVTLLQITAAGIPPGGLTLIDDDEDVIVVGTA